MMTSIIRKEIQLTLKEKGTFFWLFLLPILFIVMFASIFGKGVDTITIRYYDADGTAASKQFISSLQIKGFALAADTALPLENQLGKIRDGKQSSLLVIPNGFEASMSSGKKQPEVEFYRDATADTSVAPILAVLQNVSAGYRELKLEGALKAAGKTDAEIKETLVPPLQVKEIKENAVKATAITQVVPGYTVMFVFFIIITMIRNFIKDKDSGMLSRLRSTPLKPHQYLIGMWIPNILVVVIQSATLLLFGKLVYDLHVGDPLSVCLIVICLAVCATGIGLALAMLVRSENQGVAFTQIITMGGAIVGGLWFPYDLLPAFAQSIGKFTPQYWAQHGLQDVMIRSAHVGSVWPTLLILLAFGIAGLLVAVLRFKRFLLAASN